MKYLVSIFFLFSISLGLLAQSKNEETTKKSLYQYVDSILQFSYQQKSTEPIDSILNANKITLKEVRTYLLYEKARLLPFINEFNKKDSDFDIKSKTITILNLYDSAYNQAECSTKLKIKYYRYRFLADIVYLYTTNLDTEFTKLYKESKLELKSLGLKPERDGFGLGIHSSHGKENWIGIDFSILSYYQGVSKLRSNCNDKPDFYKPSTIVVHSINAFTFSYSKGLKTKTSDFSFSLIEINAPLTFVPLRFGVQTQPGLSSKNFYYRPGFGLSIGMVSVSYSYNLMFSKAKRPSSERLLLDFRIIYPIVNYRYRTK